MSTIKITAPNKAGLTVGKYDYNTDEHYKEYMSMVNNKTIAKELCKIDNILKDKEYWKHQKNFRHNNIFGGYYAYTSSALETYKQMLLSINEQLDA